MRDALLLYKLSKALHTECLITIIPCYVISNKFPRLLAEREIIAMLLFTNDVLDMASAKSIGKGTNNIRYWHTFFRKSTLGSCIFALNNVKYLG